jgi:hypothetical protein
MTIADSITNFFSRRNTMIISAQSLNNLIDGKAPKSADEQDSPDSEPDIEVVSKREDRKTLRPDAHSYEKTTTAEYMAFHLTYNKRSTRAKEIKRVGDLSAHHAMMAQHVDCDEGKHTHRLASLAFLYQRMIFECQAEPINSPENDKRLLGAVKGRTRVLKQMGFESL